MLKAVLFDLDGTILDSESFYIRIWQQVLLGYDLSLSDEILLAQFGGKTDLQAYEVLTKEYGFRGNQQELFGLVYGAVEEALQKDGIGLMPGVKELVSFLKERAVRMAVVTSSQRLITELNLQRHDLLDYFEFFVTRDDVTRTKPDPEPYQQALMRMNLPAEQCLVLEDSPTGTLAANAAGIPCWCVQPHEAVRDLLPEGNAVFPDLLVLRDHLAREFF